MIGNSLKYNNNIVELNQWFPSISDNGPKAISREVCGATSEKFLKAIETSFYAY